MYSGQSTYPFFTSQPNISALPGVDMNGNATTITVADLDDYWVLMPGYRIEIFYSINYVSTQYNYDNTTGKSVKAFQNIGSNYDKVSSFKLYYKNSQV